MDLTQILLIVVSFILVIYMFIFIYIFIRLNNRKSRYEYIFRTLDKCFIKMYNRTLIGKHPRLFHYFTKLEEIIIEEPYELPIYNFGTHVGNFRRRTHIIFKDSEGQRYRNKSSGSDDESKRKKD